MGLIKKILDSAIARIPFNKIINLPDWIRRCYNIYIALGWSTLTDFDTEIMWHKAIFGGYNSFIGFNPAMQERSCCTV
jgi:hypothetical protein